MYYGCRVWEGLEFTGICLLNMGMLPQRVCRTGVKCVTNTQCSQHHSTWMSYSQVEKQYGDIAARPYNRVWRSWYHKVCARRLGFLRKAQAVIWTSVLIFWSITITVVKTDHIITIMKKKINFPLIPSDYCLRTLICMRFWITSYDLHTQHIHEWAVSLH